MSFFKYLKKVLQRKDSSFLNLSEKTDNELIQIWLDSKDENVYMELAYRYETIIFDYVSRRIKDKTLSKDLVQEIFLIFLKAPENFLNKDSVKAYFLAIARNILIKNNKNDKQSITVNIEDQEVIGIADQKNVIDDELWSKYSYLLTEILEELSERDRHVCDLYYKEGYKPSEIAENLGVDSKKIRNLIYNCEVYIKKRLFQKLGKKYD